MIFIPAHCNRHVHTQSLSDGHMSYCRYKEGKAHVGYALYDIIIIIIIQSALQPLWVMACSTIVEYSQQEGFYTVPLPAARQTPNLEDQ